MNSEPVLYVLQIHVKGGRTHPWPIFHKDLSLGRSDSNDIILQGRTVSRQHALLCCRDRMLQVVDLNSTNGTFLNGHLLPPQQPHILTPCDQVRIDAFFLSVRLLCAHDRILPDLGQRARLVAPPQPGLIISLPQEERKVPLEQRVMTLGSAADNDIVLPMPAVAAYHAELQFLGNGHRLVDLGSPGGLYCGNQRISQMFLQDGVSILVGGQIPIQYRTDVGFVPFRSLPHPMLTPLPTGSWNAPSGSG
jgi:pSer/pThr/pTyr-binding forkhead associated (FHA) protein